MTKGAKLVDAVGPLAPTDFVVSKSQTYYEFLSSGIEVSESLEKSHSAPTLFRPDWRHCV